MTSPLVLVGFAAAGKSTVGRAIAARTGRRFVDLDDVIAAAAGAPVATLVARDEPDFRRREAAALVATLAAPDGPVLATGGGAAAHGDNLAAMRAAGVVVELAVDLATVRARAAGDGPRPLLQRPDDDVAALMAARGPAYRGAHGVVATAGRRVDDVADDVLAVEASWRGLPPAARATAVIAGLGARTYPIVPCDDLGATATAVLAAAVGDRSIAMIVDGNVATAWHDAVRALVPAAVHVAIVPPGEASKSLAHYGALCAALVAAGVDRHTAIVAIGGGVTGDLAGLVAATLLRGLDVVHVPTTLVAMTDSAIGGKTAIDLPAGKNLVGAFWQPRAVIAPQAVLATLPARERRAGFGELWKYALLAGPEVWRAVDACAAWSAAGEGASPPPGLVEVIRAAAAYKVGAVVRDEREIGTERVLLNLGHTIGHAIESEAGLPHGEAVGLGLVAACQVAAARGHADANLPAEVADALARSGLPADPTPFFAEPVYARLGVDKKRRGAILRFVMPHAVGRCVPTDIAVTELVTILRSRARL